MDPVSVTSIPYEKLTSVLSILLHDSFKVRSKSIAVPQHTMEAQG
jgi:hypothetical protein